MSEYKLPDETLSQNCELGFSFLKEDISKQETLERCVTKSENRGEEEPTDTEKSGSSDRG